MNTRRLKIALSVPACAAYGFFAYHCMPRKRIIVIQSLMRSGSTLLKALIANSPDVSHLNEAKGLCLPGPETHALRLLNRYLYYGSVHALSRRRVLVLKTPIPFDGRASPVPPSLDARIIILLRHPGPIFHSCKKMSHELRMSRSEREIRTYVRHAGRELVGLTRLPGRRPLVISYEELVSRTTETMSQVFDFIGVEAAHTDTYSMPDSGWRWNRDDGGERIRTLRVRAEAGPVYAPDELLALYDRGIPPEDFDITVKPSGAGSETSPL